MSLERVLQQQRSWVRRRDVPVSGDYCAALEDNLYVPLDARTRAEFEAADGGELGAAGRGKMQSLRSSSAFAVNFFGYWRSRQLGPLVRALGYDGEYTALCFERKYPHGLAGIPPNLDVVLSGTDIPAIAIESKFAEIYGSKAPCAPLDAAYFPAARQRWSELDLPRCQLLAARIGCDLSFFRLGAAQLLKHLLGLAQASKAVPRLRLAYLWYDTGSEEARVHLAEIEKFAELLDDRIDFVAMTYNALFERVRSSCEPAYVTYLAERYFPTE